jgi:serine/threonine protein kinase
MKVTVFPCGPAANESEVTAVEHLRSRLESEGGDGHWILLTNLAFSVTHRLQSDEIDIVAIGPPGVKVIEVKHWSPVWADSRTNAEVVANEAERVTSKARKIGTTLRRKLESLPRVHGAFLLTRKAASGKRETKKRQVRGVRFHTLNDWKAALDFDRVAVLSDDQITTLSKALAPRSAVAVDGSMHRLAGYINLHLISQKDQHFHRVYKGIHGGRQDRVVLHLYDLSAMDDSKAEARAKREYDALHGLQLFPWAPRILDSYQEAPGYAGEMYYFTVVDPAAPTLAERVSDSGWSTRGRLELTRSAIHAVQELHETGGADDETVVHRNLSPNTILVRHDNVAILTGFELTRIPSDVSVASSSPIDDENGDVLAPEVLSQGLGAADQRSDVFALCKSLNRLFTGRSDDESQRAQDVLQVGLAEKPGERTTLQDLEREISLLLGESFPRPAAPSARFWTEDQVVRFRDRDYRIVTRLGSGGVGTTFKVVEIDRGSGDELGTYVAKTAHQERLGKRILKAYSLARSHLGRAQSLSAIFEVAREWRENDFVSLMTWVAGTPLSDFIGVFPLMAEDQQEPSADALAIRWLTSMCQALDVLHRNGLIHGDVSLRNLIVCGGDLVLTDYDFVCPMGAVVGSPGTAMYCAPVTNAPRLASASDDIYALAASFFHVLYDREPFRHGEDLEKGKGLNWDGLDVPQDSQLVNFLNTATDPDPKQRYDNVSEALKALSVGEADTQPDSPVSAPGTKTVEKPPTSTTGETGKLQTEVSRQTVDWVLPLLQSYPGSRWGNNETRGLDSRFATQTYVPTALEASLLDDILERRARLIILCGNAGDGKTALLQHLMLELGLGRPASSERVVKKSISGGPSVCINLDGSASWKGRSADELLDEFFEFFHEGPPDDNVVQLLAINDGRLLEWIEGYVSRHGGDTSLTTELGLRLQQEFVSPDSHIRFINLNQRSLVGGVSGDGEQIETTFLHQLLDQLYGGDKASEIWAPCASCSAKGRCEIFRATQVFGPSSGPEPVDEPRRRRARERLFHALQAAHLRGETHITMRELRAALVYILFGTHYCEDYHNGTGGRPLPYWDRAFESLTPYRQGEVLWEMARFDPALEAHPQIDRHLISNPVAYDGKAAPRYGALPLESARRRAYFEWSQDDLERVAGDTGALDLARGKHLHMFRNLAITAGASSEPGLCADLCAGIARLEDLPPQALRPDVVPLRMTPRTPTETAFWVEKPLSRFRLEADVAPASAGIEQLHRQAFLIYQYRDGVEERLRLGADLFHMLIELGEGFQLGDVSTDDTFANLSIFVQRLVREDEQTLFAWNPMDDEQIYQVAATTVDTNGDIKQRIVVEPLATGGGV